MPPNTDLYVTDFYTWCVQQAALLEARNADALDWTHLAEEIQLLAGSERRALRRFLRGLLLHLLKWQYQPERRQTDHNGERSIKNGRREVRDMMYDEPGLKHVLDDALARAYAYARDDAADETQLPLHTFPEACPWTLEEVLSDTFVPAPLKQDQGSP